MQRMHLHVSVPDLAQSIRFYETLFGAAPSVVKDDYAKWMLDDPRVNFAISERATASGVDHIGIQTETAEELNALSARLRAAGEKTFEQEATTCCYAKSDKTWVNDPAGVRWETFFTFGDATTYGEVPSAAVLAAPATACRASPEAATPATCC